MTAYHITPITSVYTSVYGDDAFDSYSTGPDSLTVDAHAFLVAAGGFGARGAHLANIGALTSERQFGPLGTWCPSRGGCPCDLGRVSAA
ncbi:hypothetical protein [Paracoccus actinidiae]|uniref:hypothetical protein n=1 Tax=Paracoccus actinidiae TaxID=3064531 RepID=UPI0027D32348|nr:hypothetical protein [Paracoccus sp. M09]